MLKLFQNKTCKKILVAIGGIALFYGSTESLNGNQSVLALENEVKSSSSNIKGWKRFHSVPGSCSISLPDAPEHVKQIMPFAEEGYDLRYDVYVSVFERKAVYLLLVAQYPPFFNESQANMGLESFLNGLIQQNPENNLIFADLTEVQGHKALDFFIQSKKIYFRGRAVMANNNLYLLAMECNQKNYLENHFNHFINSFQLGH